MYNRVRDSGIFEWEDEEMLSNTFHKGDFVITTLSGYKDDHDMAMHMVKLLIKRHLSALCIKRIYFDSLPEEIIEFANESHVPILFFSDTFFDDLIFTIRNALTPNEINSVRLHNIRKLVYENPDSVESELMTKDINPFFHDRQICAFGLASGKDDYTQILERHEYSYRHSIETLDVEPGVIWSLIFTSRGILMIYTDSREDSDIKSGVINEIKKLDDAVNDFSIGISNIHTSLSETATMIKESLYASIDSAISGKQFRHFSEIGILQILCPLRDNYWMSNYYDAMIERILRYDKEHNADLFRTIQEFTHCDGNIDSTAEKLFQHANTIRYRIAKAYSVLGIEHATEKKSQLFIIVRLHEIKMITRGSLI